MKKIIVNLVLFSALILFVSNCKEQSNSADKPVMEKRDTNSQEYTSRYICPMYCKGSGSDVAGVCPVCGMDYELNENYQEQGGTKEESQHSGSEDHQGHNHEDHEGHDH